MGEIKESRMTKKLWHKMQETWKHGVAMHEIKKTWGGTGLGKIQELKFMAKRKILYKHSLRECVKEIGDH